jgi:hypothetical protein
MNNTLLHRLKLGLRKLRVLNLSFLGGLVLGLRYYSFTLSFSSVVLLAVVFVYPGELSGQSAAHSLALLPLSPSVTTPTSLALPVSTLATSPALIYGTAGLRGGSLALASVRPHIAHSLPLVIPKRFLPRIPTKDFSKLLEPYPVDHLLEYVSEDPLLFKNVLNTLQPFNSLLSEKGLSHWKNLLLTHKNVDKALDILLSDSDAHTFFKNKNEQSLNLGIPSYLFPAHRNFVSIPG